MSPHTRTSTATARPYASRNARSIADVASDPGALSLDDLEAELRRLLRLRGGNISAVAREMGKARMQIHRWMAQFGIEPSEFRGDAEE